MARIKLDSTLPDQMIALGNYLGHAVIKGGKAEVDEAILNDPDQLKRIGYKRDLKLTVTPDFPVESISGTNLAGDRETMRVVGGVLETTVEKKKAEPVKKETEKDGDHDQLPG